MSAKTVVMKLAWLITLSAATALVQAGAPEQKLFPSPEAGASALVEALKANDRPALRAILGRRGLDLIELRGASVEDRHERFLAAYASSHKFALQGDAKAVLEVGDDSWPFPIPLVKRAEAWSFDAILGEREVAARRIGRNELAAIQTCLAIADAQRDYASSERDRDGVLKYASRFVSAPGRHDGLYWESSSGEPASPLGPFVAAAGVDTGVRHAVLPRAPYHGYFYRILTRQGGHAKGGAYSYLVRGKMIGGFAVIAYPARYGYTGVKTFMVGNEGDVVEKDLGKSTRTIAERMQVFDPDPSWERAR